MKIKSDFVTNSSSTSYIVCIPEKFNVENFLHLIASDIDNEVDDDEIEEVMTKIINLVKELMDSGEIDQFQNEMEYYKIAELLDKLDLEIYSYDSPSECGMIFNINSKHMKDKIDTIKTGGWGIKHGGWGIK